MNHFVIELRNPTLRDMLQQLSPSNRAVLRDLVEYEIAKRQVRRARLPQSEVYIDTDQVKGKP